MRTLNHVLPKEILVISPREIKKNPKQTIISKPLFLCLSLIPPPSSTLPPATLRRPTKPPLSFPFALFSPFQTQTQNLKIGVENLGEISEAKVLILGEISDIGVVVLRRRLCFTDGVSVFSPTVSVLLSVDLISLTVSVFQWWLGFAPPTRSHKLRRWLGSGD